MLPLAGPTPRADAAGGADDLRTTITDITPSRLTGRQTVTLTGTVSNRGTRAWTEAQAYLVIRPEPLDSRADLAEAIDTNPGYAGQRIVDVGRFDELGDLPAKTSRNFRITIPAAELPISGADGVYPVGVQILATDADGKRSNNSVSRAVTLLPLMNGRHAAAPTTTVWPFLMPNARRANGRIVDTADLIASISPGGQLRNLLDLATSRGAAGRGIVLDPALVAALDDLAEADDSTTIDDAERRTAAQFRDELVALGQDDSAWVLDYDRTDVLALADDSAQRRRLFGAVERASEAVVQRFNLSGERVSWPTKGGVTRDLLRSLRDRGDDPVLVSAADLPRWRAEGGSLVDYATPGGDLPLLVSDNVTADLPGSTTSTTVRQRVLASAAFSSLARDADPTSPAGAVVVVDPSWNPGTVDPSSSAWTAPFSSPTPLADVDRGEEYRGSVAQNAKARPISSGQIADADAAARESNLLSAAAEDSRSVDDARARAIADVLGVRWRGQRDAGSAAAKSISRSVQNDLTSITVMGPPSVTLSSSAGGFPLTISNGSDETVLVGIRLFSSNPALNLPDQRPVEIAAGERLTRTVEIDLEQQNATTVTAQMVTSDGRAFGETSEFNVRSSRVGAVLWVTMGAAGLFVLVALARRFRSRRSRRSDVEEGPADE